MFVYVCILAKRSEDNVWELVLSFHYVVFEVDRLDRSHIYLLSDVTDPFVFRIISLFKNYMLEKRILNVFP